MRGRLLVKDNVYYIRVPRKLLASCKLVSSIALAQGKHGQLEITALPPAREDWEAKLLECLKQQPHAPDDLCSVPMAFDEEW